MKLKLSTNFFQPKQDLMAVSWCKKARTILRACVYNDLFTTNKHFQVPGQNPPDKIPPTKIPQNFFFQLRFSVATLFRFVARFAHVKIEDSSRNRFALNGIQRKLFRGDFFQGGFFRGDFIRTNIFMFFQNVTNNSQRAD